MRSASRKRQTFREHILFCEILDLEIFKMIEISAGARVLEQGGAWAVLGAHGERVEREPITWVWGQSPWSGG